MLNQIGTISSESKLKQSYFNLYDQCALKNVKTLFTEIECPSDDTANVQKQETCLTPEATTPKACTEQTCNNLDQLCEQTCKEKHLQAMNQKKAHIRFHISKFLAWFLNRIGSKNTLKHKIKQDMEREFLGSPFQPPYRDDQNSRPRVGYSQN
ncbi:hypothetical protein PVBG_04841 [Plasmodium vivax Brazil I]|uniref:Uncharacterized protein n=1 Tax=Plasmodium vivax (strain Brazil I) TaxID=1033975 RepID=A0A0J9VN99_PLAV1|nr:hypothetical protein PVBG_04841 [Plasmodium vivax Brazil I]